MKVLNDVINRSGAAAAKGEVSSTYLKQSILRNSNQSGISGVPHGVIPRTNIEPSQVSNSLDPKQTTDVIANQAGGALSSNSSLSPLGPKP